MPQAAKPCTQLSSSISYTNPALESYRDHRIISVVQHLGASDDPGDEAVAVVLDAEVLQR